MEVIHDGIIYSIKNGSATVKSILTGVKYRKDIIIPYMIENCPVEVVGVNAFSKLKIKSIILPWGIKQIQYRAFADCEELENVTYGTLPKGSYGECLIINEAAFSGCHNLKSIKMAKYLDLNNDCFSGCHSLSNIDAVKVANGEVFINCYSLSTVTFAEDCDLVNFIDIISRIKTYNFLGKANLSVNFADIVKSQNIKIECCHNSNLCDLAYEGISVYTIEELF